MAFCLGILYGWGQTIYSYLMKPHMVHNSISHLRLVLSILSSVFFIASKTLLRGIRRTPLLDSYLAIFSAKWNIPIFL